MRAGRRVEKGVEGLRKLHARCAALSQQIRRVLIAINCRQDTDTDTDTIDIVTDIVTEVRSALCKSDLRERERSPR